MAWFMNQTRAPASGADPSALCGKKIRSEDDVLHVVPLPTFDGRLSQRDSELLISYLTVPYLRIPLVLWFFACPERIYALGVKELQAVVDGCLFEPSLWQEDRPKVEPTTVPAPDRQHLATPCGLLFNELLHSPIGVLEPIQALLELALDIDTGKFSASTSRLILFIVRLVVRVENYMRHLVYHNDWLNEPNKINSTCARSFIRGLATDEHTVQQVRELSTKIRSSLQEHVFPMIERWSMQVMMAMVRMAVMRRR